MPEMHLKESGFTYSVCGSFTRNKKRIKNQRNRRFKIYFPKRIR